MAEELSPSDAFDELVGQEIKSLAAILNESHKSIAIMVVAVNDEGVIEMYVSTRAKDSARAGIVQGFREETDHIEAKWRV